MYKKIIYLFSVIFFIASCETMNSVKRGLTGEKRQSTDEFLIKKKDPLVMPPNYSNLPTPDETNLPEDEFKIFEKNLETSIDEDISKSSSVEQSILKKIRSK